MSNLIGVLRHTIKEINSPVKGKALYKNFITIEKRFQNSELQNFKKQNMIILLAIVRHQREMLRKASCI